MRIALFFGGPSDERNISAGSIKPWVLALEAAPSVRLSVVFFDRRREGWLLPRRWYHTNTCEDFEAQLGQGDRLGRAGWERLAREQDLVVPLIHGAFGEDGVLQARLEELGVPYLFSRPDALARSLDKARCYERLDAADLPVPAHFVVRADPADPRATAAAALERARALTGRSAAPVDPAANPAVGPGRRLCAIKPVAAGSSLGVSLVEDDPNAVERALAEAFEHGPDALVEELLSGTEFSVVVVERRPGEPVALAPTEIELRRGLFDTRSKYLHGEGARLRTPLLDERTIPAIRSAATRAFGALGLRHMARIDGFVEPSGRVLVTDVNGISGLGLSSFVFLQTTLVGWSHTDLIRHLIGLVHPTAIAAPPGCEDRADGGGSGSRTIAVLFGGPTSERQVSRQSGVFCGLSLASLGHRVRFVTMDTRSRFTSVGRFLALHHDVEEIEELVRDPARRRRIEHLARAIGRELGIDEARATRELHVGPTTDLAGAVGDVDFAFLALHGGSGEDGTLQTALEALGVPYNGAGPEASRIASDKWDAVEAVRRAFAGRPELGIGTPTHRLVTRAELFDWCAAAERDPSHWQARFAELASELDAPAIVFKPRADGCSTGVKLLTDAAGLGTFARAIVRLAEEIAPGQLGNARPIKLPIPSPNEWVVEGALIEARPPTLPTGDPNANALGAWYQEKRYVELTVAVLERDDGRLAAAMPSITVAAAPELSLEEKFQQGTGTNLELSAFEPEAVVDGVRERVRAVAEALGIRGYARIDGFWDRRDERFLVIEPNTLCGLTEATVFFTQVLGSFGLTPPRALDEIVARGLERSAARATASCA